MLDMSLGSILPVFFPVVHGWVGDGRAQ